MGDRNSEADGTESDEDAERDGDAYEVERLVSREAGAAALRRLADGVANGSVELGDDDVAATVPSRFELEIEYEQGAAEAELEVELEWPIVDGEAVVAGSESEDDDREETEAGGDDARTDDGDEDEEAGIGGGPAAEAGVDEPIEAVVGAGDATSAARFELYRDRADEWRWRLVHDNGNIIADSGEGYGRKATARKGLESVMRNAPGATVVETDD